jgi:phage terminase small subunit
MSDTKPGAVELTPRQSRFVDEYLIDLNATAAAERAGYSAKTAYSQGQRLLKNVEVANEIQQRMDERSDRVKIDADFVLQGIAKNIARCEQGSPIVDRNGEPVMTETPDGDIAPAWRYDATNALKGYELLGKHLKLFTEKHDHTSSDGSMGRFERVEVSIVGQDAEDKGDGASS